MPTEILEINLTKSLQENARLHFEKAKKAKKKLKGIKTALKELEKKMEKVQSKKLLLKKPALRKKRKKKWFEKFHWFKSSDGFLVLGGRDAQNNETLIKKYMEESDLYFHADVHGAAHCLIKSKDNAAPESTLNEAAIFAAVYSKAWQEKMAAADVYSVLPSQVSKKSPSGEALGKGAFMIYGKRKWFKKTPLKFALGLKKEDNDYLVFSGPPTAVKKHCLAFIELKQGTKTKGEIAKTIKAALKKAVPEAEIDLDEIIKMLPSGGLEIKAK